MRIAGLESRQRRLDDPETLHRDSRLLTVRWVNVRRRVGTGIRGEAMRPVRASGHLHGTADEVAEQLASGFTSMTDDRRLLIIGEPGGGKSTLARLLCLGLVKQRADDEPVPVLIKLSAWDRSRDLLPWIARTVAGELGTGARSPPRSATSRGSHRARTATAS